MGGWGAGGGRVTDLITFLSWVIFHLNALGLFSFATHMCIIIIV